MEPTKLNDLLLVKMMRESHKKYGSCSLLDGDWGVQPLVGPFNQRNMMTTWKIINNGKVESCIGPVCEDCTCGYKL